jgi:uncharacterized membrane protein YozB (DUF420 family)
MIAPAYSTFALIAEPFVTAAVFYTFYQGFRHDRFPKMIAFGAIAYETLFNISYMFYKLPDHLSRFNKAWYTALAATHGILSILMFIGLIVFFILAYRNYKKGVNYFRKHKYISIIFLSFWLIALFTGFAMYYTTYYY